MSVQRITNITTINNFNEFKSTVGKYGYALSNMYDILFNLPGSSTVFSELLETFRGADGDDGTPMQDMLNLMRLYTTECTMPGVTMADSEYRITNTPQLKYAYGAVFNEFTVTFLMDSESLIRKVFDKWTNVIYPYSQFQGDTASTGVMRTAYKDSYVADITVVKYERSGSSKRNRENSSRIPSSRILPNSGAAARDTFFRENIPVHAVKMKNAFPKTIDSMSLSGEGSALTQFSVSFEYESLQVSSIQGIQSIQFDPNNV